ncbi:hypothetical protein [Methylobacterium haplocladii]|nr:hypothetical protein [Methylobacterium haplocladii]
MSLEAYVLFDREIAAISDWQRGLDELGFPLSLASEKALKALQGHLPAWWNGREAGFECGLCDAGELSHIYDDIDLKGAWRHAMAFNWGTLPGCAGALMAAAALTHATGGVLFDPQESVVLDPAEAVSYARDTAASIPDIEARFAAMKERG